MKNNDSDWGCFLKGILPACCCFVYLLCYLRTIYVIMLGFFCLSVCFYNNY